MPFPTLGDRLNSGIEPASLASLVLAGRFFTTGTTWEVSNLLEAEQFPCYTEQGLRFREEKLFVPRHLLMVRSQEHAVGLVWGV